MPEPPPPPPPPLDGCRVLLVEDDPADAAFYSRALLRAGAAVSRASDAEAAAAMIAAGPSRFDVCVVDLVLPGMRGTELVAAVRAGGFRRALLGLSAHLTPEVTELWYAAGCDAVLAKSGDRGDFVRTVTALCQTFGRR